MARIYLARLFSCFQTSYNSIKLWLSTIINYIPFYNYGGSLLLRLRALRDSHVVANRTSFPKFKDLPMELKLKIWDIALLHESTQPRALVVDLTISHIVSEDGNTVHTSPKIRIRNPVPALLHTCLYTRTEALKIYFPIFELRRNDGPIEPAIYINPGVDTLILAFHTGMEEAMPSYDKQARLHSPMDPRSPYGNTRWPLDAYDTEFWLSTSEEDPYCAYNGVHTWVFAPRKSAVTDDQWAASEAIELREGQISRLVTGDVNATSRTGVHLGVLGAQGPRNTFESCDWDLLWNTMYNSSWTRYLKTQICEDRTMSDK